jgi:hypothetical protein
MLGRARRVRRIDRHPADRIDLGGGLSVLVVMLMLMVHRDLQRC